MLDVALAGRVGVGLWRGCRLTLGGDCPQCCSAPRPHPTIDAVQATQPIHGMRRSRLAMARLGMSCRSSQVAINQSLLGWTGPHQSTSRLGRRRQGLHPSLAVGWVTGGGDLGMAEAVLPVDSRVSTKL